MEELCAAMGADHSCHWALSLLHTLRLITLDYVLRKGTQSNW